GAGSRTRFSEAHGARDDLAHRGAGSDHGRDATAGTLRALPGRDRPRHPARGPRPRGRGGHHRGGSLPPPLGDPGRPARSRTQPPLPRRATPPRPPPRAHPAPPNGAQPPTPPGHGPTDPGDAPPRAARVAPCPAP